jgi:hypothetical protein
MGEGGVWQAGLEQGRRVEKEREEKGTQDSRRHSVDCTLWEDDRQIKRAKGSLGNATLSKKGGKQVREGGHQTVIQSLPPQGTPKGSLPAGGHGITPQPCSAAGADASRLELTWKEARAGSCGLSLLAAGERVCLRGDLCLLPQVKFWSSVIREMENK